MRQDPFVKAVCREDEHQQWAREHRASMWDFHIEGESDAQAKMRRYRAAQLCIDCPVRQLCGIRHAEYTRYYDEDHPGVWAGKTYRDHDLHPERRREGLFAI